MTTLDEAIDNMVNRTSPPNFELPKILLNKKSKIAFFKCQLEGEADRTYGRPQAPRQEYVSWHGFEDGTIYDYDLHEYAEDDIYAYACYIDYPEKLKQYQEDLAKWYSSDQCKQWQSWKESQLKKHPDSSFKSDYREIP